MTKRYRVFLIVLFCAFLGVFSIAETAAPDREFSPLENRTLALRPTPEFGKGGNFFSGEFMQEFETYVTDQFPLRDGWIALKARCEQLLGKKENNGVYLCGEDTLIPRFEEPDGEQVRRNISYVDTLAEKTDVPVFFSLIPGAVSVWSDKLPAGAPNADQRVILALAGEGESAVRFDVDSALRGHSAEEIYYRTDHHWTSLGAYYGYTALAGALGLEVLPIGEKRTVSESFYGTSFSTSGVRSVPPDSIDIYGEEPDVTVSIFSGGTETPGRLYEWDNLAIKDQYTFFLGGNHPLAVVRNPACGGPAVLLIRDSYADSLVPFLIRECSAVHLIDLRYYKASVADYIAENAIDAAVVLYSVDNFCSESNLYVLAR